MFTSDVKNGVRTHSRRLHLYHHWWHVKLWWWIWRKRRRYVWTRLQMLQMSSNSPNDITIRPLNHIWRINKNCIQIILDDMWACQNRLLKRVFDTCYVTNIYHIHHCSNSQWVCDHEHLFYFSWINMSIEVTARQSCRWYRIFLNSPRYLPMIKTSRWSYTTVTYMTTCVAV